MNIIIKRAPSIDIQDTTIVASDGYRNVYILGYDSLTQQWVKRQTLQASDPDSDPFGPTTVDGSYFGASVKIDTDKIFVGAPGKNHNSVNDVGAIYVYTRQPNAPWASGTESNKLLPNNKDCRHLFRCHT
jgi:hypothetical protein